MSPGPLPATSTASPVPSSISMRIPPMLTRLHGPAPPRIEEMTEDDAPPRRSGAGWKLALRIIVSVALLVVLARNLRNPTDVIPSSHHLLTTGLLIGALLITLLGVIL